MVILCSNMLFCYCINFNVYFYKFYYEKGKNKAQVLDEIAGEIFFFGDKMDEGGNDYPIAKRLELEKRPHTLFKVKNPIETWEILKKIN